MEDKDGLRGRRNRLAGLAGLLDRFLLPLVLISAGLGIAVPGPGRRLDANGAILITLAVLVFCTGTSVTFADISGVRAASRRIVLVLAATTIALPVLAWLASRLVSDPMPRGGVLAAGVAPVEVASVAFTGLAGGEVAVAAGLLVASTLLTVLLAGRAPRRAKTGPARRTVSSVDATSSPAAIATSPPARPVNATDATSTGATPAASTPLRGMGSLTSLLASHASTGSVTLVTASTSMMRREAARRPLISAKVTDVPVQNTSTARVIKIAPLASRRRPGPGRAIPSPAEIRTRGRRKLSSNRASPASRVPRPRTPSLPSTASPSRSGMPRTAT